tara:strand:+ start:1619 stop:2596 length:978 start_codon:yes stop_codon:yes gene_type:complete
MKGLKYSDICLIPEFGVCNSRAECDTSVVVKGRRYKLPVMPANMKSVVSDRQCEWLSQNDYLYSMHRFDVDIESFIDNANRNNWKTISISLGVKKGDKDIVDSLRASGARVDIITLDIAHGYCELMRDMLRYVRENLGPEVCIIAGNVATPDAVVALYAWGADYVKVGIGQGSPCTTKDKTGFTMPMFTSIKKCGDCYASRVDFDANERIPIIADGGIRSNGDIAKALVAGADLVMAGGLFACCSDSPSASIEINGVLHKAYYGSASFENKKTATHIEGKLKNVPSCGMNLDTKLKEITEDLQSAISYAGGTNVAAFKNVRYIEV